MLVDRPLRLAGRNEGDTTRVTALDADDVLLATGDIAWE